MKNNEKETLADQMAKHLKLFEYDTKDPIVPTGEEQPQTPTNQEQILAQIQKNIDELPDHLKKYVKLPITFPMHPRDQALMLNKQAQLDMLTALDHSFKVPGIASTEDYTKYIDDANE